MPGNIPVPGKPPFIGPPIGLPPIQPGPPGPPVPIYPEGKSGMRPDNMEDFPTFIDGPPGGGQMYPELPGQGPPSPPGASMGRNFGRFGKVSSQPQNTAEILRRAAAKRLEMG